jgi:hypothetical protein
MTRIFDATTGTRPTAWSLTTATGKTYVNSSGVLSTAGANTERLDYNPSGLALLGLLYEPSVTNWVFPSNAVTGSSAGYNFGGAVTLSAATGPDGVASTAARANYGGGSGSGAFFEETLPTITGGTASRTFTVSGWLKQNAGGTGKIAIGNTQGSVLANFSTQTPTSTWIRYSYTVTNGGSAGSGKQVSGFYTPSPDGACDVLMGFIQCEIGPLPTSYIPTTSAAVTRGADSASFTLAATSLTFTFDDATTQTVSGLTSGSTYTIPTTLNRTRILYIDDSGGAATPFMFPRNRHYVRR